MPPPAPWWGAVCSAAAPVLLAAGSTIGGHLQPRHYNAMTAAELIAGAGLDGLAERVLGGTLTLWPPLASLPLY